jgi:hypothetical protein
MDRKWTRRRLFRAAAGTLAASTGAAVASAAERKPGPSSLFRRGTRETLRAAMDDLIPASDGMPAASDAGVMSYLETLCRREPSARRDLTRAADALAKTIRPRRFASLEATERARALAALENGDPGIFAAFRDLVYEGYYTNPDVWRRIGFVFYGPERFGPGVGEFDDTALARVRTRLSFYRRA